ncbi:hypothetical protein ABT009_10115 [Streptomyces sp. NPDC002896]|uniref:hypothetical protein n=1 Tax=Streptomyces sp. NPDC002896 TaxID=3154438 RepID=UPI003324A056
MVTSAHEGLHRIFQERPEILAPVFGVAASYFYQFLDVTLGKTPAREKWRGILSFVSYFPGRGTVMETAYLEGKAEGEAKGSCASSRYAASSSQTTSASASPPAPTSTA